MIVQCPNCDTRYRLDETRLDQDGAQVRCSRCSHVFFVSPPRPEDDADVVQDSEFDWLKDVNLGGGSEQGEDSAQESPPDLSYEKKDGNIALEIQPSEQPRTRAVTWVLAGIALVSLLLGALLYFPALKDSLRSWFSSAEPEVPIQQPEVMAGEEASQISLQNVRQYFVSNEKIGQLFVVEGKARNDFPTAMELIKIEANLFDEQGEVVQRKEFLAGNTVSLFQLQILSEEELEAALQAKVGILSNNTNLRPGMDVPFMVVFPNPPETIQEYGLKVIEARRPPQ